MTNALKYTLEGYVDVTARVVGDQVQVDVTDTGIGMTEEDLGRLFTRFFRASTARAHEISGTGLGLAITRSLIEMHGGRIWVKSQVGQGSTFSFTLPLLPEPLTRLAPSAPAAATTSLRSGPRKILIVDDELHVAQLFRHQLEADNYVVFITTRGKDALPLARRERPDLILLDVLLRDADGLEVLQGLKQDPDTQAIPVVITSIVGEQEKGFALGAADYLAKPIGDHQLQVSVRRVLDNCARDNATSPSVLVVDDEPDIRTWLSLSLSNQGVRVAEAADGAEALLAVAEHPPSLILLDLMMPKMDGWTVIRKLKADPRTAEIPIIVLTARAADPLGERVQVLGMGVQQFFTKPVSVERIVEEIRKQMPA